jgi:hypothetical protein
MEIQIRGVMEKDIICKREDALNLASQGFRIECRRLCRQVGVRFACVYVVFVEPYQRFQGGFFYRDLRCGNEVGVELTTEYDRRKLRVLPDKDLAAEMVAVACFMLKRYLWQLKKGTIRKTYGPDHEWNWIHESPLGKSSPFMSLRKSPVGKQVPTEVARKGAKELYVRVPKLDESQFPDLADQLMAIIMNEDSLGLEDLGYIVPSKTLELILTGSPKNLKRVCKRVAKVLADRPGAFGRIRPEYADRGGTALFKIEKMSRAKVKKPMRPRAK